MIIYYNNEQKSSLEPSHPIIIHYDDKDLTKTDKAVRKNLAARNIDNRTIQAFAVCLSNLLLREAELEHAAAKEAAEKERAEKDQKIKECHNAAIKKGCYPISLEKLKSENKELLDMLSF